MIQFIVFVSWLVHAIQADVIPINDVQNFKCLISNACERDLSLKCDQEDEDKRILTFSSKEFPNPWNIICKSLVVHEGQLTLNIDYGDAAFEVRKICMTIQYVKSITVEYTRPSGGKTRFQARGVPTSLGIYYYCVKEMDDSHETAIAVTLVFTPRPPLHMKITKLDFQACGDSTGVGPKATMIPVAAMDDEDKDKRLRGHTECADEHLLNYESRSRSIVRLIQSGTQSGINNILDGSGGSFTGQTGQNVDIKFEAQKGNKKLTFAWWKVCFLVRNADKITFEMESAVDRWVQTFDVCEPESYVWKCYFPWDHFEEIEKGSVSFQPGSSRAIFVKDMSISICRDAEFTGDIIRLGKEFIPCPVTKQRPTNVCHNTIKLGAGDAKNFTSPFDMSHRPGSTNTSRAWRIVRGQKDPFITTDETFSITMRLRTNCPGLDDNRYQARAIQFKAKNMQYAHARFCDRGAKTGSLYCEKPVETTSEGIVDKVDNKEPAKAQKYVISRGLVSTAVNIVFTRLPGATNMTIWSFNVFACCDKRFTKRKIIKGGDIGKSQERPNITGDQCVNSHTLEYKNTDFFSFSDDNSNMNEILALRGAKEIYLGPRNRDVYFNVEAKDGFNLEFFQITGRVFNVYAANFILETSSVTYVHSKLYCGNDTVYKVDWEPKGKGLYMKRLVIKLQVVPGRTVNVTGLKIQFCRDHFHNSYKLHIHPCDYRSLVIDTPRNETITVYTLKDQYGNWKPTELYHYTDHTGNNGDNTWFRLEPKHHLIKTIWTDGVLITLNWDIVQRRVSFHVYIEKEPNMQTVVKVLDLNELTLLDVEGDRNEVTFPKTGKHCISQKFDIRHCGNKGTLTATCKARGKGSDSVTIPARAVGKGLEVVLPKKQYKSGRGKTEERCRIPTEIFEKECKNHAILNRRQHWEICTVLAKQLQNTKGILSTNVAAKANAEQACKFAYKTLRWMCQVMADRPRQDSGIFFTEACTEKNNFKTINFFRLFGRDITVVPKAFDTFGNKVVMEKKSYKVARKSRKQPEAIVGEAERFNIVGYTTDPEDLAKDYNGTSFKLCFQYKCALAGTSLIITVTGDGTNAGIQSCQDMLDGGECCIDIYLDPRKYSLVAVARYHNNMPVLQPFEIFIPSV